MAAEVDHHPDHDNVWIVGGGSGFKHGPMMGEYVADRIMGRSTDAALDQYSDYGDSCAIRF
jgi:sarcosine oxidase